MRRIGLVLVALMAGAGLALCQAHRAAPSRHPASDSPPLNLLPAYRDLLSAQLYHLAATILWLSAAGFIAGLILGLAAPRRAGALAIMTVVGFIAAVVGLDARPSPSSMFRPIVAIGAGMVVIAAGLGGWVGQSLWHGGKATPPEAQSNDDAGAWTGPSVHPTGEHPDDAQG